MADKIQSSEYALVDSPSLIGVPTTVNPRANPVGKEITNVDWVIGYVRSQLNTSPHSLSTVLYVAKHNTGQIGEKGNINKPYATIQQALDNASSVSRDVVFVLPGEYPEQFTHLKSGVNLVFCDGAKVTAALIYIGSFGNNIPFDISITGGEFTSLTVMCRQSGGMSKAIFTRSRFTGSGGVQYIANNNIPGTYLDTFTLRECRFDSNRPMPPSMDVNTLRGPVRINNRAEFGPVNIILDNTIVTTTNTSCITISATSGSANRVTLLGNTELRPGLGQVEIETIPNGQSIALLPIAEALIDKRIIEVIAENQYGTHPAFTSQARLNEYLLKNKGTGGTTPPTETIEIIDVIGDEPPASSSAATYSDSSYTTSTYN